MSRIDGKVSIIKRVCA